MYAFMRLNSSFLSVKLPCYHPQLSDTYTHNGYRTTPQGLKPFIQFCYRPRESCVVLCCSLCLYTIIAISKNQYPKCIFFNFEFAFFNFVYFCTCKVFLTHGKRSFDTIVSIKCIDTFYRYFCIDTGVGFGKTVSLC